MIPICQGFLRFFHGGVKARATEVCDDVGAEVESVARWNKAMRMRSDKKTKKTIKPENMMGVGGGCEYADQGAGLAPILCRL